MERITAPDGAGIVVHSVGTGSPGKPGIVVVHGGGVTIGIYRRLAARLSDRFAVHLYNRRGREDAAPRREPYSVDQEIEDLGAVLEHTGAGNVLGHSYGGFVALKAALELPIERIGLYDAAISIDGRPDAGFLPAAEAAVARGDIVTAMAIVGAAVNNHSAASRLPLAVQKLFVRAMLRIPAARGLADLLPMTLVETREVSIHDGPAERYAGITAEVLLASGDNVGNSFTDNNEALARVIPNARTIVIPRSRHDAIAIAHPRIVAPFAEFFAAPKTLRHG